MSFYIIFFECYNTKIVDYSENDVLFSIPKLNEIGLHL